MAAWVRAAPLHPSSCMQVCTRMFLSVFGSGALPLQGSHAVAADFRGQLARLNRELLFAYLDLVDCLVERPSAYARAIESVGLLARNMAYLLNALRAHQARGSPRALAHTDRWC